MNLKIRNTFIIFLVSGFWHGANWTFIIWGALNALYFLPLLLLNRNRNNIDIVAQGKLLPSIFDLFKISSTFCLTVFAWIFFRAENVNHAIKYIAGIFTLSTFTIPIISKGAQVSLILIILFVFIEWLGREDEYAIEKLGIKFPKLIRWSFYSSILFLLGMFMATDESAFIYFQF